jgi:hypothetical protein
MSLRVDELPLSIVSESGPATVVDVDCEQVRSVSSFSHRSVSRSRAGSRSAIETVSQHHFGMIYSFSVPTAMNFKALYDETGWADWILDRFERALSGSWVVCTVRDDADW